MKKSILLAAFSCCILSYNGNAQTDPKITSWLQNTTVTGYGGAISNVQLVQYSATQVYVSATCIPEYSIGPWPGNPNIASPQNVVCQFTRTPAQNTASPIYTGLGAIGLWTNGVAVFNQKDANYWNNTTSSFVMGTTTTGWNRNALVYEGAGFDNCLGHPQQAGMYHHHVNPKCLYNDADNTHHSPIIGFAFDGFPIYGAYGYANVDGTGGIKRMLSSYVLSTATTRPGGPPVNATYPLGNMCEDYVYTAGAGDLDAHNGRFCVTPEYPAGTYAYFLTIDASLNPVYPYVLGNTYYGTPSTGNHVTPAGSDTTYHPSASGVAAVNSPVIKFQVVPNPVEDYAYIYMDAATMNNVKATLVSASGQIIKTMDQMLQPTIGYALDLTDVPSGIYILTMESGGTRVTERIVRK
jgi:hypothetical protein